MLLTETPISTKCSQCQEVKPQSEFYKFARSKTGYRPHCRFCHMEQGKDYVRRHAAKKREYIRNYTLARVYKMTPDEYQRMFDEQHGLCAICNKPQSVNTKSCKVEHLDIDHDHVTGQVRGLLCRKCNMGIGKLPSATLCFAAMEYFVNADIKSHSC